MDKKRTAITAAGVAAVLALAVGVVWFGPWGGSDGEDAVSSRDRALAAAEAFADAWGNGTLDEVATTNNSGDVEASVALRTISLGAVDGRPDVEVIGVEVSTDDRRAVATASVTWRLDDVREWTYDTSITVVAPPETEDGAPEGQADRDAWLVDFTPATVHPTLRDNEVLRAGRTTAARGQILDKEGLNLTGSSGSVVVGIRSSRTDDPAATARTVAAMVGVDADELVAKVAAAGPDEFVEVITMDRPAYDAVRADLQPLPGTVFREESDGDVLPPNFARGSSDPPARPAPKPQPSPTASSERAT